MRNEMNSIEILKELEKYDDELTVSTKKLLFEGKVAAAENELRDIVSGKGILEKFKKDMQKKSFMRGLKKVIREGSSDGLDIMRVTTSLITHLTIESKVGKQREVLAPYIKKVWTTLNEMISSNKFDTEFLKEFID